MDNWFASLSALAELPAAAAAAIKKDGFTVLPGPLAGTERQVSWERISHLYDAALSHAPTDDTRVGSATTRVRDFVNRDPEFDQLYLFPPMLQACCLVIGQPFKLSTIHARTLRPQMPAQTLHVDFAADAQGWPMLGFIYMVDAFTEQNGATCFLPGSQGRAAPVSQPELVPVCGPAGSLILFNGSAWHGHGPNRTDTPRRSLQGAFIRRTETSGEDLRARMLPATLGRLGPLARYLLALGS